MSARNTAAWAMATLLLAACTGSAERQAQYLAKAQASFAAGDYDKARVDVRNALQIDGNNAEARFLFAQLFEREQNWQQMFANLNLAVELDPTLAPARLKLGTLLVANRLFEEAHAEADALLALDPDDPDALALRGAIFYREGDSAAAETTAQRALGLAPGHVDALAVLTQVYKDQNPQLALTLLEDGMRDQSEHAALQLLAIQVHEENGEIDQAAARYDALIAEDPDNLFFYYRYVTLLQAHGRGDQAEALIRGIVQARPDDVELKLWLAQYLVSHRDAASAETALRQFIEREPGQSDLKLALADVLIAQRKLDQARTAYAGFIADDPESDLAQRARNGMVRLDLATGERARADALLAEIFELEPENPEALLTQARLAFLEQDYDAAIGGARSVLRHEPESIGALDLLARAHQATGVGELALDNYRQILSIQPGHQGALLALTEAALQQGELDNAVELAAAALRSHPENTEAARLLVAAYTQRGDIDQAVAQAESLAGAERTRVLGTYLLGRIALYQEDFEPTAAWMREVLALEPGVVEALQGLVIALNALDRRPEATEYLLAHAAAHPQHVHALLLLAQLELRDGDRDGAIETYTLAMQRAPRQAAPYLQLGDLHAGGGDLKTALTTYEQGLEHLPRDPALLVRAAQMHELQRDFEAAIRFYETALTVSDSVVAKNNLAMLYADHMASEGNLRKAVALLRPHAASNIPALLDTLGWVHYRLGDGDQAVRYIRAAIDQGGDDVEMRYHLGMAYALAGENALAQQELAAAVDSGEDFHGIDAAREQLEAI